MYFTLENLDELMIVAIHADAFKVTPTSPRLGGLTNHGKAQCRKHWSKGICRILGRLYQYPHYVLLKDMKGHLYHTAC